MNAARWRRLAEELAEVGFVVDTSSEWGALLVTEIDYALRPNVHERRIPSVGAIIEPTTSPEAWSVGTDLEVTRRPVEAMPLAGTRLFADGLSSWLIRRLTGEDEWAVFDRPAGSERDLVVLAESMGAVVVQRHPSGSVRVVGDFGVLRWEGLRWHKEPPIAAWIDSVTACAEHGDRDVLEILLGFAVHDLGSRGIGALLVYQPEQVEGPTFEVRLPTPPTLDVRRPSDLAPLRHALSQVDGAAVFDAHGVLRELGVRLVPSPEAENVVEGLRGMRHTSGRRYSFDDPSATVIVISEDGPVTVVRGGELLGTSPTALRSP
ncbi:MAG: diadenylate cyclase [Ilumatobacteraceae bacterium]